MTRKNVLGHISAAMTHKTRFQILPIKLKPSTFSGILSASEGLASVSDTSYSSTQQVEPSPSPSVAQVKKSTLVRYVGKNEQLFKSVQQDLGKNDETFAQDFDFTDDYNEVRGVQWPIVIMIVPLRKVASGFSNSIDVMSRATTHFEIHFQDPKSKPISLSEDQKRRAQEMEVHRSSEALEFELKKLREMATETHSAKKGCRI